MKKGISVGMFEGVKLEKCFQRAKEEGFDGIELSLDETGELGLEATKEDAQRIRDLAERCGLKLYSVASVLYWDWIFTSNDPKVRQMAEKVAKKQLEAASWLGCDSVLIIPGMVCGAEDGEEVPYDTAYERALEAMRALAPLAEELQVRIGLENVWNKFLLSPLEMRDFIDAVGSDYVGAYFDVGNMLRDGYAEQWIRILGKRIVKVHFKDYKRGVGTAAGFCDILSGDVNYPAVMEALAAVGYDDWVTAEVFPYKWNSDEVITATSRAMDRILNKRG